MVLYRRLLIPVICMMMVIAFITTAATGSTIEVDKVDSNHENVMVHYHESVQSVEDTDEDLSGYELMYYGLKSQPLAPLEWVQSDGLLGMVAHTHNVVGIGGEFIVEIVLSDVQNVDGIIFTIGYDPSVLKIKKNQKGHSITENPEVYQPEPPFNNPWYRYDGEGTTRMDGYAGGLDFGPEPVWLGRITFELLKEAETNIEFTYSKLSTPAPPGGLPQRIQHHTRGCRLVFDFTPPEVMAIEVPEYALIGSEIAVTTKIIENVGLERCVYGYSKDEINWELISEVQPVWDEHQNLWLAAVDWLTTGMEFGNYQVRVTVHNMAGLTVMAEGSIQLGGSVQGQVLLEGIKDNADLSGTQVRLDGTIYNTTTCGNGYYMINGIPVGTYELVVTRPDRPGTNGYLDRVVIVEIAEEHPQYLTPDIELPTGDINGDNIINYEDLSIMRQDYGTAAGRSDLNKSGVVCINDLVLIFKNYNKKGDTYSNY